MSPTRADDMRLLKMLDCRDGEGMTGPTIAERFGTTRNAVAGAFDRVKKAELPCACRKRLNKDGGMGRGWWK